MESVTIQTDYASGGGRYQVARGEPVRDGWLRFSFRDDATYNDLASAPELAAIVTVDREAGRVLGVRFLGRS